MSDKSVKNPSYNLEKLPPCSNLGGFKIQVNCCKNPDCDNFNIPIEPSSESEAFSACENAYKLSHDRKKNEIRFQCLKCLNWATIYNNKSIYYEYLGISGYFDRMSRANICRNPLCKSYYLEVEEHPDAYFKNGKTKIGLQKYKCKSCRVNFTEYDRKHKTWKGQTVHHKNRMIFKLLMSQVSLRSIIDATEIGTKTLYDKIDFFYDQCRKFSQAKEKKISKMKFKSLKISSDHQFYQTNWRAKGDNEYNTQLYNLSSADNNSGYVFISSLNFDPNAISDAVNQDAHLINDLDKPNSLRRHARYILENDYDTNAELDKESPVKSKVRGKSTMGIQVYKNYTMFAHFIHLREMLGNTKYLTLYNDFDSVLSSIMGSVFVDRIENNTLEAYALSFDYHSKGKSLTEREELREMAQRDFDRIKDSQPELKYLSEFEAKCRLVELNFDNPYINNKQKWHYHPTPGAEEVGKRIWWITEREGVDISDISGDIIIANNYGVDRFFQTCRRKLSFFERTNKKVALQKDKQRNWSQYGAYDPAILVKLLEIMRVYYNFVKRKDIKDTPAQKLGIVKKGYDITDILHFKG